MCYQAPSPQPQTYYYIAAAPYAQQYVQSQPTWLEPSVLSWKQRKVAYGRSDRLRRIAVELSRKDYEDTPNLDSGMMTDFCLTVNEKDNTSASETSKSHPGEAIIGKPAQQPKRLARGAKSDLLNREMQDDDDDDNAEQN